LRSAGGLVYSPPGSWVQSRSPARWSKTPRARDIAPPVYLIPHSCTPNPAPPPSHARGRSGTTRGSSASQPPVVFCPYPPWVVGAGSDSLAPQAGGRKGWHEQAALACQQLDTLLPGCLLWVTSNGRVPALSRWCADVTCVRGGVRGKPPGRCRRTETTVLWRNGCCAVLHQH
jgi:hypothetical protein